MEESRPAWYVVHVKRHAEQRVVRHLRMNEISTFLPLIESVGRGSGPVREMRLEPLFPGYLFVDMPAVETDSARWHLLQWTPGVRRILGAEARPVPMPAEAMAAIRARMGERGFVQPLVRFQLGDAVRIRRGPLAGLTAMFDCPMSKSGRVRVLLALLGQVGRVEVDEGDLDAA